jgi:hypothetical protein
MTSHETAIADRLHEAAGRIPVDTSGLSALTLDRPRAAPRRSRRRRAVLVGVGAAVASAAALAVVVGTRPTTEKVTAATTSEPSEPEPAYRTPDACLTSQGATQPSCSPSLVAHVASPPAWFGVPQGGFMETGHRAGRWTSMAIGRVSADANAISQPIVVSVFDGTYTPLDDAEPVTIDGVPFRLAKIGSWHVLATDGTPTVMVEGAADEATLKAVLDAAEVNDVSGELALQLQSYPDGFTEVVSPRVLGTDYQFHRSLGSETADDGIHEVSDMTDPLLAAARTGADLTSVDIGGTTGWVGGTDERPEGPLRFLIWSPRSGVVFEIVTLDMQRSYDDLVDLALATSTMEPRDWDMRYVR